MTIQIAFRSGMSRANDFHGAVEAGVAVGVVAGEITPATKMLGIPKYLAAGGAVFIDSGAFTSFRTGVPPNFNRVLSDYEVIADCADPHNADLSRLFVVSPDAVGDQQETLRLLQRYRERILALIEVGCQVIVPIQCGAMPAAAMLDGVKQVLGTNRFVAGIPSNAAAMSIEECASLRHHSFHILGRVQMDDLQAARISALEDNNPGVSLTADANWLRSRVDAVCKLKDAEDTHRRNAMLTWQERFLMGSARSIAVAAAILNDQTWAATPEEPEPEDERGPAQTI